MANLVRLGYLAKGLIYVFIGVVALGVAFGLRGGKLTDPSGVLATLLKQPFGTVMLTLIGVGHSALCGLQPVRSHHGSEAGWRALGTDRVGRAQRHLLTAMGAGVVCFGLYQLCHARFVKLAIN